MKIFLAGTFSEAKQIESLKRSSYLLESYYYIKPWQIDLIHHCEDFLLDSGAFTFMMNNKKHVDFEEYVEKYADFINDKKVEHFFELDIDSVVGYSEVLRIRNKLEKLTGKQCVPVWHPSRGKEEFLKMCDEYNFVALGGIVSGEWRRHDLFSWFIKEAHKRKTKIHGLGYTKVQNLTKFHFDSVDSTRWNCARFGRLEYFDGKTIRPIDRRKEGKRLKSIEKKEIMKFTFNEWIKFQQYAKIKL